MLPVKKRLGVVFDLDGTLVNSMPMVLASFTHAIKVFQETPSPLEIFDKLAGPADICLRNLLDDETNLPEAMNRLLDYNSTHHHQIVPFAGAAEMLENLLRNGTEVALWTGRDRETTDEILTAHNLWKYFQVVVCGDDFTSHKPDPEGLVHILGELSLQNSDVLFVGDADVDVLAGYASQVPTMLIRHGRTVSSQIKGLCREWVETPQQAYEIVLAKVAMEAVPPSPCF
jgi:pyrophosphatase PpaX